MKPLTAAEIAEAAGGTLIAGDAAARADSVSTDSRAAGGGCVFVALRGDRFDGHEYVEQVGSNGATVAVVDRDVPAPPGLALVRVADTRRALGKLASAVRRSITRPKVVAIAGSNGKTSTKNALHTVLSQTLRGSASPKSFNNEIGVPGHAISGGAGRRLRDPRNRHESPGRGSNICHACVNRTSPSSRASAKSTWNSSARWTRCDAKTRPSSPAFDRADCWWRATTRAYRSRFIGTGHGSHSRPTFGPVPRVFAGEGTRVALAMSASTLDGTHFRVNDVEYAVPNIGAHFATNALAIIAVARHLGLGDETIRAGLAKADASDMRMQRLDHGGVTILNDAYNANPTSMQAAIDTLRQIEWSGRKVAVVADMKELGDHSAAAHRRMAEALATAAFDAIYAIGPAWLGPAGSIGAAWFADADTAAGPLADATKAGDLVLLKGSRSMKLERVADAIAARHA